LVLLLNEIKYFGKILPGLKIFPFTQETAFYSTIYRTPPTACLAALPKKKELRKRNLKNIWECLSDII
jgi:hypothetical protein